jgi:hypothetical protein
MPIWWATRARSSRRSRRSRRSTRLGEIYQAVCAPRAAPCWLITADHGNAELMIDPVTGGPHTAHTTNPVPFIVMAEDAKQYSLKPNGSLRDISPTILGLGSIGRAVAKSAKALGMRVIAVREHPEKGSEGADAVFRGQRKSTRSFGKRITSCWQRRLRTARRQLRTPNAGAHEADACLINVGRGPLVDETALAAGFARKENWRRRARCISEGAAGCRLAAVGRAQSADHSAHGGADRQVMGAALRAVLGESAALSGGQVLLAVVDKCKGY